MVEFLLGGVLFFVHYSLMVRVGIFTLFRWGIYCTWRRRQDSPRCTAARGEEATAGLLGENRVARTRVAGLVITPRVHPPIVRGK